MSLAKGIQLLIGDAGDPTEVFTAVNARVEFTPPSYEWASEDLTNHDNTTPVTRRGPTLKTIAGFPMTIKPFDSGNTQHVLLRTRSLDGAPWNYKITYPHSTQGTFAVRAFIQNFQPLSEVNVSAGASFTLMPTGNITDQAPTLVSVTVIDAQAGAYVTAEKIILRATFDESVKVTGTPRIAIVLDSGTVYALYVSGSGSYQLQFEYTVGGGDTAAATEMSISSPLELNGGTIKDTTLQAPAALTFTPPDTSAFTVNP